MPLSRFFVIWKPFLQLQLFVILEKCMSKRSTADINMKVSQSLLLQIHEMVMIKNQIPWIYWFFLLLWIWHTYFSQIFSSMRLYVHRRLNTIKLKEMRPHYNNHREPTSCFSVTITYFTKKKLLQCDCNQGRNKRQWCSSKSAGGFGGINWKYTLTFM